MEIRVATLCDFAQVREGLLSILSAGITRVWHNQYPAPLGVMLALILEINPSETLTNEVRFRIEDADGARLAEASGMVNVSLSPDHDKGEMLTMPLVVDFREVPLPVAGRYQIVIEPMNERADPTKLAFRAGFPSEAVGRLQQP